MKVVLLSLLCSLILLSGCQEQSAVKQYQKNPFALLNALTHCEQPSNTKEESLSCADLKKLYSKIQALSFTIVRRELNNAAYEHRHALVTDTEQWQLEVQRCENLGKAAYTKNSDCLLMLDSATKKLAQKYHNNMAAYNQVLQNCAITPSSTSLECTALISLQKTYFYLPLQNYFIAQTKAYTNAVEFCAVPHINSPIKGSYCNLVSMTTLQNYINKFSKDKRGFSRAVTQCQQWRYKKNNADLCTAVNKIKPIVAYEMQQLQKNTA